MGGSAEGGPLPKRGGNKRAKARKAPLRILRKVPAERRDPALPSLTHIPRERDLGGLSPAARRQIRHVCSVEGLRTLPELLCSPASMERLAARPLTCAAASVTSTTGRAHAPCPHLGVPGAASRPPSVRRSAALSGRSLRSSIVHRHRRSQTGFRLSVSARRVPRLRGSAAIRH